MNAGRSLNAEMKAQHQRRLTDALVSMLADAHEAGLPPLRWTVNCAHGSGLHGETDDPLDDDPQGTFLAWVEFLGTSAREPCFSAYRARWSRWAGATWGGVSVGLLCLSTARWEGEPGSEQQEVRP